MIYKEAPWRHVLCNTDLQLYRIPPYWNTSCIHMLYCVGNYCCILFIISWILSFILSKYYVYLTAVCLRMWSPAQHISPAHLERYWLTCLQICTKNVRCPNLLSFKHIEWPGCYVNLVREFRSLVFLVVYQLHYFYLLLRGFQLLFPFLFRFLIMLDGISPIT